MFGLLVFLFFSLFLSLFFFSFLLFFFPRVFGFFFEPDVLICSLPGVETYACAIYFKGVHVREAEQGEEGKREKRGATSTRHVEKKSEDKGKGGGIEGVRVVKKKRNRKKQRTKKKNTKQHR